MAKSLRVIQAIAGEGELHRGDTYLGQVVYGFSTAHDVEFIESRDASSYARADIRAPEIDLWPLKLENADLTLRLNNGDSWACKVGCILDHLLGSRASLVSRHSRDN